MKTVFMRRTFMVSFAFVSQQLFLLFFMQHLWCTGYKGIRHLDEAEKELALADVNSLVIFDVDNVLITSQSAINRPVGEAQKQILRDKHFAKLTEAEKVILRSVVWMQDEYKMVEPYTASTIHSLQKRKIPTIALTAYGTGTFGCIKSMEESRINQLEMFCIDFSLSAPKGAFTFKNLNEVNGHYPSYKNGILFTNWCQNSKGAVLVAFLKEWNLSPKKVFFFDDTKSNLDSVYEALSSMDIEFFGFHYTAENLGHESFDVELAEKQLEHLCKHKEWLCDRAFRAAQCKN